MILFLIKMLFIWKINKHNFLKLVYILLFSIHFIKITKIHLKVV